MSRFACHVFKCIHIPHTVLKKKYRLAGEKVHLYLIMKIFLKPWKFSCKNIIKYHFSYPQYCPIVWLERITFFVLLFLFTPVDTRDYSWLCAQRLLLAGLDDPVMELGSAAFNITLCAITPVPNHYIFYLYNCEIL